MVEIPRMVLGIVSPINRYLWWWLGDSLWLMALMAYGTVLPTWYRTKRRKPWLHGFHSQAASSFHQVDCPFNQIPCTYCGKIGHLRSKCRDAPKDRRAGFGWDLSQETWLESPELNGFFHGETRQAIYLKVYHGRFFGEIFVNKLDPHFIVKLNLDVSCGTYTRFLIFFGSCWYGSFFDNWLFHRLCLVKNILNQLSTSLLD